MTPIDLKKLAVAKFGPDNWMTSLAAALGVDGNTVRRWAKGRRITPDKERHIRLVCDPIKGSQTSPSSLNGRR